MRISYCGAKDCLGHRLPTHKCDPRYITRTLRVYVFENSQFALNVHEHVSGAVEIWQQAGIRFLPWIQYVNDQQAVKLIGPDKTLQSYHGVLDRDDLPGATERYNLARLKGPFRAMAVFFVENDWTRADPQYFQAYIGHDYPSRPGRTVAHEIGHLLLGEGHTGDRGGPTSGLMVPGNRSSAWDISDTDAERAKIQASKISLK
jgi:hypothetical protein